MGKVRFGIEIIEELRATLAARDERVRELEGEVAEWQSRAKELLEEGCRGSNLNAGLCEQIAGLEAELAAIRPRANAVRKAFDAFDAALCDDGGGILSREVSVAIGRLDAAIADACPEKGGAG